jgi:NAD(P)H dehydrogenase (quinone)
MGVFGLPPPSFDPTPGFLESRRIIEALRVALERARPARVVCISTVGAQARQENLLTRLTIQEQVLGELPLPITFLRPAWYLENTASDVVPARNTGIVQSFLQPLDRRIPWWQPSPRMGALVWYGGKPACW